MYQNKLLQNLERDKDTQASVGDHILETQHPFWPHNLHTQGKSTKHFQETGLESKIHNLTGHQKPRTKQTMNLWFITMYLISLQTSLYSTGNRDLFPFCMVLAFHIIALAFLSHIHLKNIPGSISLLLTLQTIPFV